MTNETSALHLRRALTEIAETIIPDGLDLWPSISASLTPQRKSFHLRKALVASALLAVAVVSIAAVTVGPQMIDEINSLLFANSGIEVEFGDPMVIGQEQTIDEITVRLLAARVTQVEAVDGIVEYGQVAIEYLVSGLPPRTPVGLDLVDGSPELVDAKGRALPGLVGIGTDSTSESFAGEVPEGSFKAVWAFDLSDAPISDGTLQLKLTIPLIQFVIAEDSPTPVLEIAPDGTVMSAAGERYETIEVGLLEFDFTLPVVVVPGDGERNNARPWIIPPPDASGPKQ